MTGWTVAVFSALAVLLGAWSYNHIGTTYYYDPITQVLYGGLHRGVWCLALAWVVVACHFGYGGLCLSFSGTRDVYSAWACCGCIITWIPYR